MNAEEDTDDNKSRLYDVLNLPRTANTTDIRESHRRLSRLFHPDKHSTASTRDKADPKFQEIQHAFEVLSDPQRKAVYDNLGEDGLSLKLDVGQRHMTPEQLKAFWYNQSRQSRVEELDALTQTRGDTAITVDARAMFGDRVVVEKHMRVGSPIPMQIARPATWQERVNDVMFRGLTLRQSFTIPFTFSKLFSEQDEDSNLQPQVSDHSSSITFASHASATSKKAMGNFGVITSIRHQLSPKTTLEASMPFIAPRTFRTKITHQYSPEIFMSLDTAASTLSIPPEIVVTTGRQITERGVIFGTLRSGSPWKLGPWGEYGNAASYILGWTQSSTPKDPSGYTVELITGLQVLGAAADYNTSFKQLGIKMKLGGSVTTGGMAVNIGASRKITEHTRLGASVLTQGPTMILRLTFSRLGQNFKLPIWIGDGYEFDAILYGVIAPLAGLVAWEHFVVSPRRQSRRSRQLAKKRSEVKDRLAQAEQAGRESIEVMAEAINRKQEQAKSSNGLYIQSASYGTIHDRIDVTIATAAFIIENQLVLPRNVRKRTLTGFWDPAFGESKTLRVTYTFAGEKHFVEVDDKDPLALPSQMHVVR